MNLKIDAPLGSVCRLPAVFSPAGESPLLSSALADNKHFHKKRAAFKFIDYKPKRRDGVPAGARVPS
jgi:hypothetical protein